MFIKPSDAKGAIFVQGLVSKHVKVQHIYLLQYSQTSSTMHHVGFSICSQSPPVPQVRHAHTVSLRSFVRKHAISRDANPALIFNIFKIDLKNRSRCHISYQTSHLL